MFWRKRNNKWFLSKEKGKRKDNKEYHKKYMREWIKRPEIKERHKKYRQKPESKRKHNIRQLVKKIPIPKNQNCEICHKRKATERHHEDYNKPLKIKFICLNCHRKIHKTQTGFFQKAINYKKNGFRQNQRS